MRRYGQSAWLVLAVVSYTPIAAAQAAHRAIFRARRKPVHVVERWR